MNPNMFGQMGPGALDAVPTTEKLWQNEKEKYRHWIILFAISILAIFALLIVGLVLNIAHETRIKHDLASWGYGKIEFSGADNPTTGDLANPDPAATKYLPKLVDWASNTWRSKVITQSLKAGFVGIGVVLFASTVYQSYQNKSFAKISGWATMTVGLGAIMGVWQLMSMWIHKDYSIFSYSEGIYDFILYILPIVVFFFVSRPLNKIKRQFAYAERVQMIKQSPQYQQMMQQAESMRNGTGQPNMGPMGPMGQPMPMGPTAATPAKAAPVPKELTEKEKRVKELSSMKIAELREIAKKLSLSGIDEMKKAELIDAIIRVSE